MDATFEQLKGLVAPYAKHFAVLEDTSECYDLEEELPGYRTQFAVVRKSPRDVKLYFYPLHVFPELRAKLPASLAKRVVHKSVFKLTTTLTAAEAKALRIVIADAWHRIAAIRDVAAGHPYNRPFSLDQTFALLKSVIVPHAQRFSVGVDAPNWYTLEQRTAAAHAEVASLYKRKAVVDLLLLPLDVFPKLKVPALLSKRVVKPGVLRFKTITPAERDAVSVLLEDATRLVAAKIKRAPNKPYA